MKSVCHHTETIWLGLFHVRASVTWKSLKALAVAEESYIAFVHSSHPCTRSLSLSVSPAPLLDTPNAPYTLPSLLPSTTAIYITDNLFPLTASLISYSRSMSRSFLLVLVLGYAILKYSVFLFTPNFYRRA